MRFLSLALLPAVLGAALERRGESGHCAAGNPLSCAARFNGTPALRPNTKTVAALVEGYAQLIGNYTTALGQSYLAEGFTDTSGSINSLAGIPLTDVTFASKEAFMANQATQPAIPLVVTAVSAVTRDTVVIRWTQTFGKDLQVAGISILGFACGQASGGTGSTWQLETLYTEFNSLAYYQDIGGSCTDS